MAKNKKKRAQMFKNFLAFKAGQGSTQQQQQPTPQAVVVNQPSSFQTPHGDQEKLTELIDDNSGGGPNTPISSVPNTNPVQTINKWTALKPAVDSTEQIKLRQDPKRPNLTIVEGKASKIQLVMDKSKKIPQPTNSPKPVEEPKSNTPPMVAMPIVAPQPIGKSTAQPIGKQTNQPMNAPLPKPMYTLTPPQTGKKYPSYAGSHLGHVVRGRPAGIPRSMLANVPEPKQIQSQPGLPHGVSFVPEENSPSPQTNLQADQAERQKPIWDLAPHAKPYWPTQGTPGFVWPPTMPNTPVSTAYDTYWPPPGQEGNDISVEVDMNTAGNPPQAYSPSDVYSEGVNNEQGADEELESSEMLPAGSKRLSAFQRLGPVADQPKKTKLTINLLCQKDVRNVVDETDDIPTHLRDYMVSSTDEIVLKYLDVWPFKKNVVPARTATARQSKSVMMLETEYMEEAYTRDNRFILVSVTGYPPHWRKEDVIDAVLESVRGMSFIPCFIEFTRVQCRFLVIRCRLALLTIHKYGFIIHKNETELIVSLSNIHLNLNQLDFVPRLMLRKLLLNKLDGDSLDLSNFTMKNDISHFIYFPLHRASNQTELVQLQSSVPWFSLTKLDLSHNKISTIGGIDLLQNTPRLQHLNLSHNCIEKATMLLQCRNLPLKTIHLEGNPLCYDYIEQEHYIKVLTMLFTGLVEIDGVQIRQTRALRDPKCNYCPEDAQHIVEKVLEVMFPLLDASPEQRFLMEDLYDADAVLTITFMYKLRYGAVYKDHRNLFMRARVMDEGDMESVIGASAIAKILTRWPDMIHDPSTFNVDVMYHTESTTILRIGGIVKITTKSLADEEYVLSFTRTLVLHTKDESQYKITNELLYWDLPEKKYAETAFQITRVKPKNLILRLDAPPDKDLKEKLLLVFMQLTELEKGPSERCLEEKDWNFRHALEYFTKLLKLDNLDPIMKNHQY